MLNKDFWMLMGTASATISGFAFIVIAIYYSYIQSIRREASKLGLKGAITNIVLLGILGGFSLTLIPLVLAVISLRSDTAQQYLELRNMEFFAILFFSTGIALILIILLYFDRHNAHFVCTNRFIDIRDQTERKLESELSMLKKIYEISAKWLKDIESYISIANVDKETYEKKASKYRTRIQRVDKCGTNCIESFNSFEERKIISYGNLRKLLSQHDDLKLDIENIRGEIETDIKGMIARFPETFDRPKLEKDYPNLFDNKMNNPAASSGVSTAKPNGS